MKVLHVQNCAAVPYTIAKELTNRGHESKVLSIMPGPAFKYNPLWLHLVPDQSLIHIHFGEDAASKVFMMCKDYDIIHVHIWDRLIWWLKSAWKRPVVLTYHGYDIRGQWKYKRFWEAADKVTVSTEDLLAGSPTHVEHVPNPVDRDFWSRLSGEYPIPKSALWCKWLAGQTRAVGDVEELCKKEGLSLTVQYRARECYPYIMMPRFMSHFERYIDSKYDPGKGKYFDVWTLTGLQALSMDIPTYRPDCGWVYEFPWQHDVEKVVDRWEEIYKEVMEGKHYEYRDE